jgi:hypothetical protein
MYSDEMRAGKWDGLSLWRRLAAVVLEYDGHTVPGLTWDALSRPGLVYLQPIFVRSLCDVSITYTRKPGMVRSYLCS